jgi:tRNA threonylcarbamoyladenosine biosynthesis protein TsaE
MSFYECAGMMSGIQKIYTYEQAGEIAALLAESAQHGGVMTLTGPIGAGKTTLIRVLLQRLGVREAITSPTFTYVSCYKTALGRSVYHFDLYRIQTVAQFEAMGFSDYLYEPGALVIIEWPEVIAPLLTMPVCTIALDYARTPNQRAILITMPGE